MAKIKDIKTAVYQWKGKTVQNKKNFCTNASDLFTSAEIIWIHLGSMNGWSAK